MFRRPVAKARRALHHCRGSGSVGVAARAAYGTARPASALQLGAAAIESREPALELLAGHGLGQQPSLRELAAVLTQEPPILQALHAFGDGLDAQLARHLQS